MQSLLKERIESVKKKIESVTFSCGRKPEDVQLIAVSKTVDASLIQKAYELGLECFGENRVQELTQKVSELPEQIKWHMIGHLQTNKVKQVIVQVDMIQSLDRPELYLEIEKEAIKKGVKEVECLIQVNSSGEDSKFGFAFDQVEDFVEKLKIDSPVKIKGLMTIGPFTQDQKEIRQAFKRTRELRDRLERRFPGHGWSELSMGMSGDYRIAIEEGSTMVRIGSAIFGSRK